MKEKINLAEFQRFALLSDQTIMAALKAGLLPIEVSDNHEILIDLKLLKMDKILTALTTTEDQNLTACHPILIETVSRVIREELETILAELSE